MNSAGSDYGLWGLVAVNSIIFIGFAYSFFKPVHLRDWQLRSLQRLHRGAVRGDVWPPADHLPALSFVFLLAGFTLLTLVQCFALIGTYEPRLRPRWRRCKSSRCHRASLRFAPCPDGESACP